MNGLFVGSVVVLWILGAVVFALTRQVGVLLERVAPAGGLNTGKSLQPGEQVPTFQLETIAGEAIQVGGARGDGRSQLVFFVSSSCSVCEGMLPTIREMAVSERDWLDIVLASDGEEAVTPPLPPERGSRCCLTWSLSRLGSILRRSASSWRSGRRGRPSCGGPGLVDSREHLESLIEAKQQGLGPIQEYLKKN